jgi:hypothetical protein
MLDVAEIYVGKEKSGVDTVRRLLSVYRSIISFVGDLQDSGTILLATECDLLDGFNCVGGLSPGGSDATADAGGTTRYLEGTEPFYGYRDEAGFPMTPAYGVERELACLTTVQQWRDVECNGNCNDCGSNKKNRAKCKATQITCKASGIEGLDFPWLSNPLSLLDLIKGEDIVSILLSVP